MRTKPQIMAALFVGALGTPLLLLDGGADYFVNFGTTETILEPPASDSILGKVRRVHAQYGNQGSGPVQHDVTIYLRAHLQSGGTSTPVCSRDIVTRLRESVAPKVIAFTIFYPPRGSGRVTPPQKGTSEYLLEAGISGVNSSDENPVHAGNNTASVTVLAPAGGTVSCGGPRVHIRVPPNVLPRP